MNFDLKRTKETLNFTPGPGSPLRRKHGEHVGAPSIITVNNNTNTNVKIMISSIITMIVLISRSTIANIIHGMITNIISIIIIIIVTMHGERVGAPGVDGEVQDGDHLGLLCLFVTTSMFVISMITSSVTSIVITITIICC